MPSGYCTCKTRNGLRTNYNLIRRLRVEEMSMLLVARVLVLVLALLIGCSPRPSATGESTEPPPVPAAPKRISIGVQSDFNALATRLVRSGTASRPGVAEVEQLVNARLTQTDGS